MTRTLAALALCALGGCASTPAADPCGTYRDFAAQVEKDKRDTLPMGFVLDFYRNQVADDAEHSAEVVSIVRGVYLHGEGAEAVYNKCKGGAFATKGKQ